MLQTTSDAYRKLRNTVRYLLGALPDYSPDEAVELEDMPPLERFILHRLWELDAQVRAAYEGYLFQDVIRPLTEFCQNELSSLFLRHPQGRPLLRPPRPRCGGGRRGR